MLFCSNSSLFFLLHSFIGVYCISPIGHSPMISECALCKGLFNESGSCGSCHERQEHRVKALKTFFGFSRAFRFVVLSHVPERKERKRILMAFRTKCFSETNQNIVWWRLKQDFFSTYAITVCLVGLW